MRKVKALLAAALALGATAQAAPVPANQFDSKNSTVVSSPKVTTEQKRVVQSKEIQPDGLGGIYRPFYDYGRPPKYYGQWLQSAGRQKWTKKKR